MPITSINQTTALSREAEHRSYTAGCWYDLRPMVMNECVCNVNLFNLIDFIYIP
jgi:hypothetical protein